MITDALRRGAIKPEQRFKLHDLKRKGTIGTIETRSEKQDASGNRTEATLDVYDHSTPVECPARE